MVVIGQNFGGEAGVFGGEAGVFGGEASPPPPPLDRTLPTRLLGFMHCFCLHFGISLTKFLGSVHRRWRHNVIPCQVPCTAAVGTLSYRAGLLHSLLCCGGHIVMPCQVAGFHALLVGEHCCNRLLSSVQCCCVRLSFSVCYCHVLCGICHVWYHNT